MEYKIYKLHFKTGVHFGKNSLESTGFTIGADTFFSAMCHEFLKQGIDRLEWFLEQAFDEKFVISDALPFIGDTYYLPKPMLKIEENGERGNSTLKKAYKKLSYIPADLLDVYLKGHLDVKTESEKLRKELGSNIIRVNADIRGEEETKPYRVGTYYFKEQSGLYIVVGYEDEEILCEIEDCLSAMELSGIGGKRNAGLGKFELQPGTLSEEFYKRLVSKNGKRYMSLSGCLPKEDELESALESASYLLIKRSSFVNSEYYAKEHLRKKDLYILQSGSCFANRFIGDIYDVSDGGNHKVYRYAKPLFLEVIS